MTPTLTEATAPPVIPARAVGVLVRVSEATGAQNYTLKPVPWDELPGDAVQAYRLRVITDEAPDGGTPHVVSLLADGSLRCTCHDHQAHHGCQHADALEASGILNPWTHHEMARLRDELASSRRELWWAELEQQQLALDTGAAVFLPGDACTFSRGRRLGHGIVEQVRYDRVRIRPVKGKAVWIRRENVFPE